MMTKSRSSNKSNDSKGVAYILALLFVFVHQWSYSQYNLPKPEILAENKVKVIRVRKTPVKLVNRSQRKIFKEPLNKTPRLLTTYFINQLGRIDSVYHHYQDTTKYNREIFRFGSDNQLQEIQLIDPQGEVLRRRLLEQTEEKEFHLRQWSSDVLIADLKITSDSIITEITSFQSFTPVPVYTKTVYDLDNETMSNFTYEGEILMMKEIHAWQTQNGIPLFFTYTKHTTGAGNKSSKTETKEYLVDDDGSIMSENKGLFTDPFASFNYFDWLEHFTGFEHPFAPRQRAATLVKVQEASEVIDFEGSSIVYEYSLEYGLMSENGL